MSTIRALQEVELDNFWKEFAAVMGGPDGLMTYRYLGTHARAADRHHATGTMRRPARPARSRAHEHEINHERKRTTMRKLVESTLVSLDGVDDDCLAQACLFAAFAEFVSTYGEEPAAQFAEGLAIMPREMPGIGEIAGGRRRYDGDAGIT